MGKVFLERGPWRDAPPRRRGRSKRSSLTPSSARSSGAGECHSSVAGQTEYAFRHILVRDVAYGQTPAGSIAPGGSLRAAALIGALGFGPLGDHAELLARPLARRPGAGPCRRAPRSKAYVEPARGALLEAGDRALALNAFRAVPFAHRGAALDLMAR